MDLQEGIHCYQSKRYGEAITYFSSIDTNGISYQDIAILNVWLGKCYFYKEAPHPTPYFSSNHSVILRKSASFSSSSFSDYVHAELPLYEYPSYKRMITEALDCFKTALQYDANLDDAHYWKGKALMAQGSKGEAYRSFAKAASLSPKPEWLKKCYDLFSKNVDLPFEQTAALDSINFDDAIGACSSQESYLRMQSCQYFLNVQDLSIDQINRVKEAITPLAGFKLLCVYLPYTGDGDSRVNLMAKRVLLELER